MKRAIKERCATCGLKAAWKGKKKRRGRKAAMEEAQARDANSSLSQITHSLGLQGSPPAAAAGETCIDPAYDDPETFSCECLQEGMRKCNGQNVEKCINEILCTSTSLDICQASFTTDAQATAQDFYEDGSRAPAPNLYDVCVRMCLCMSVHYKHIYVLALYIYITRTIHVHIHCIYFTSTLHTLRT